MLPAGSAVAGVAVPMSVLVGYAYGSLMWGCVTGVGLTAAIVVAAAGIRW
ncbi:MULTISPECIES: hypothetical protein [unclassified Rhodococcus (in: high G+C Gram-positive bacteria)]|nr:MULTISPECIES: hypothetical protein [unclassified Rhodococcus (in: high G+C Gram-positive bacteria)]MBC2644548.1 hypothetical protein [Rhodococcus sp. 3A]MBC2897763.1 hypothetical protein [Rhodococcus sp. 4CII]